MTDITKACRDINELSSVAKKACTLFLEECKKANLPIFITETYRSQARQNYLYEQGRSRPGTVVTWTHSSNHTGRMAWDIAVDKKGLDLYDIKTLEKAGAVAKKLGITWGGTWSAKNLDRPHFEVDKNWKAPNQKEETKKQSTVKPKTDVKVTPKPIVPYPGIVLFQGQKGMKKIDIERIQRAVGMKEKDVDGVFGSATTKAVKAYQKKQGLTSDGQVGLKTWNRMF